MTWVTGTATDHQDLLDQLEEIATSQHAATVSSIGAGGTGYVVGDILTVSGGTSTHAAKVRVTTIGGSGDVTGAVISEGGAYTSNPSNPASTTGGSGDGACTVNLTYANTGWTRLRRTQEGVSATVGAGGSGHAVNDKLTLVGGVGSGTATVFNVDSVSSGAVTAVSLDTAGDYEVVPANDASTTSDGSGTGCELTVTYQDKPNSEFVLMLEGEGGGSDQIFVGFRTYNIAERSGGGGDTCYNWSLNGMTGHNAGLTYQNQPGISGGDPDSATGGSYVPLKDVADQADGGNMSFWMSIDGYHIKGCAYVPGASTGPYCSWYVGWLEPAGTSTEYPYPIYVAGSTPREDIHNTETVQGAISGLTECIGSIAPYSTGPAQYRRVDSVWSTVSNSNLNISGSRTGNNTYIVHPCAVPDQTAPATDDQLLVNSSLEMDDIIPNTGVPGSSTYSLYDTPETGDDLNILIPATVIASDGTFNEIWGALRGVYWVSAAGSGGTKASQDTITIGTDIYRIFQNGNKVETFSYMCFKEE